MSRAIDAAPPSNASVVPVGHRPARQLKPILIDAPRQKNQRPLLRVNYLCDNHGLAATPAFSSRLSPASHPNRSATGRTGKSLVWPEGDALGGIVPRFGGASIDLVRQFDNALSDQCLVECGEHGVIDLGRRNALCRAKVEKPTQLHAERILAWGKRVP